MLGFQLLQEYNNNDEKIIKIAFGSHTLKTFSYNIDKISHSDLIKLKFIDEVCNEYPDLSKKQLLLVFADADNDMLEYYKLQCPDVYKIVNGGVLMKTSHPDRTERLYNKLTPDEKEYLQMKLATYRKKFLNYV